MRDSAQDELDGLDDLMDEDLTCQADIVWCT